MSEAVEAGAMPRHIPLIFKLMLTAILIVAFWPLPGMIAYSNPAEGVILGRYTRLYAGLLAAYLVVVVVWAGITAWVWAVLDASRLAHWRRRAAALWQPLVAIFSLFALGAFGYVFTLRAQFITLPAGVQERMEIMPLLVYTLAALAVIVAFGPVAVATDKRSSPPSGSVSWIIEHWSLLSMVIVGVILIGLVLVQGLLTYPVHKDASAHVYIGQHLWRGGVPYRTVFYFHPPLRFVISALWTLTAKLSGLSPVPAARVFNLLLALGLLGIVFGMGERLTGRRLGGLLALLFLVFSPALTSMLSSSGPTLKLVAGFFMAVAVLLTQQRRWLWAGVAAACAVLMWLPAGGIGLALLIVALLQGGRDRWLAVRSLALGAAIPVIVAVLVLLAAGILAPALRQTLLGTLGYLQQGSSGTAQLQIPDLGRIINLQAARLSGALPTLLAALAILLLALRRGLRELLQRPEVAAPILAALLMTLLLLQDDIWGGDISTIIALFAPLSAAGVVLIADLLRERLLLAFPDWMLIWLVILPFSLPLLTLARVDPQPPIDYADQIAMATELDAALGPDDKVQCFDKLWFLVLTGRDNALPVMQIGPKAMAANRAEGWDRADMIEALSADPPAVIMLLPDHVGGFSPWLEEMYTPLGNRRVDASSSYLQAIYVLKGRDDLIAVIDTWPTGD